MRSLHILFAACAVFASAILVASGLAQAQSPNSATAPQTTETAVFAAGCFWCVEEAFEKVDGVVEAISGFAGGQKADPSYKEVVMGDTGHTEAVKVVYDPAKVTYSDLLNVYWVNVDPHDGKGQFCDRGASYRPALFPLSADQAEKAKRSIRQIDRATMMPVAVRIEGQTRFYPAEDYHQDYYKKSAVQYQFYKWRCGREARLDAIWGKDRKAPLDLADLRG